MKLGFSPVCAAVLFAFGGRVRSEEPEKIFDRKLADGYEPAALLEGSTSPDGNLSVLFTARKKGLKPANWPAIIPSVPITSTDVLGSDDYTTENWIVSIPEKKRLGVVRSASSDFKAWHRGQNLRYFYALWGPEQEGWHYGLLSYNNRWGCTDVFLVNCDGTDAKLTNIRSVLDTAARKSIVAQKKKPQGMEIGYEPLDVPNPGASVVVSDSLTMRIVFVAQVPKSDDDSVEGTMTVKLARDAKGVASATVLGVKPGCAEAAPQPAPTTAVPSSDDFAAMRKLSNERAKSGAWKIVTKDQPGAGKGREHYVKGWIEANVVQQLIHVDSRGGGDEMLALYYWHEGVLVSVFKFAKGSCTKKPGLKERTDTYNFHDGRLVQWSHTPGGVEDPKQDGFQDLGAAIQKEATFWAQPIYQAIGAD